MIDKSSRSMLRLKFRLLCSLLVAGLLGCSDIPREAEESSAHKEALRSEEADVELIDPPVGPGAMAPNLATGKAGTSTAGTYLTWIEPVSEQGGHAVYISSLGPDAGSWSDPELVVEGQGFFANWADLPAVTESRDGTRFVHWLSKLGEETYAYGAMLARTRSDESGWQTIGLLHDDDSPSEHGFVSYVPLDEGGIQAFWLDGRDMPGGGDMQLRTTRIFDGPEASEVLDRRVCECCATDAALAENGPMVVYRDRSPEEIRDIAVIRATAEGWTKPVPIHDDGWKIEGCPVNGPAISTQNQHVAVAWFNGGGAEPGVKIALSGDGGETFHEPIMIDSEFPLGRVDATHDTQGRAIVSWMGTSSDGVEIRFRTVAEDGELGKVYRVAGTSGNRSAGVPRMMRHHGRLLFAWVEDQQPSTLRTGLVDLADR